METIKVNKPMINKVIEMKIIIAGFSNAKIPLVMRSKPAMNNKIWLKLSCFIFNGTFLIELNFLMQVLG